MPANFFKVGIIYGSSTLLKMLIGVVSIKIISFYLGTEGLGRLGQFMSIMTIITLLAGGAISTGVIRNISACKDDLESVSLYLKASFVIWWRVSLVVFFIMVWQANYLSALVFGSDEYYYIFVALAFAQAGIGLYNIFINVINAHQDVIQFGIISSLTAIFGALGLWLLIFNFGIKGAMFGLLIAPLIGFFLALFGVQYKKYLPKGWLSATPQLKQYKSLFSFSIMAIVSACTMPVVQIIVRDWLAMDLGWHSVGIWQGMVKLSDVYLQFITIVLANYYLPRLAEKNNFKQMGSEMILAIKIAIAVLIPLTFLIWLLREMIVLLLFGDGFLEMKDLFFPQLIGDIFKILSYIIGYIGVAKGLTLLYVAAELLQSALILFFTSIFIKSMGVEGAVYANALTYFVYFIVCISVYLIYCSKMNKGNSA